MEFLLAMHAMQEKKPVQSKGTVDINCFCGRAFVFMQVVISYICTCHVIELQYCWVIVIVG